MGKNNETSTFPGANSRRGRFVLVFSPLLGKTAACQMWLHGDNALVERSFQNDHPENSKHVHCMAVVQNGGFWEKLLDASAFYSHQFAIFWFENGCGTIRNGYTYLFFARLT